MSSNTKVEIAPSLDNYTALASQNSDSRWNEKKHQFVAIGAKSAIWLISALNFMGFLWFIGSLSLIDYQS